MGNNNEWVFLVNNAFSWNDETILILFFFLFLKSQSAMPEERRNEVHDQRFPLLQFGSRHKRRRRRKHRTAKRERNKNFVDEHEP